MFALTLKRSYEKHGSSSNALVPAWKAGYDRVRSSFITVLALSPTFEIAAAISSLLFPSFLTHCFAISLSERSIRLRSGLGGRISGVMAYEWCVNKARKIIIGLRRSFRAVRGSFSLTTLEPQSFTENGTYAHNAARSRTGTMIAATHCPDRRSTPTVPQKRKSQCAKL